MHLRILKTAASTLLLVASFFGTGTEQGNLRLTNLREAENKHISLFTPSGNEYRLDSWTFREDGSIEGSGKWFAFRSRGKNLYYPFQGMLPPDSIAFVTLTDTQSRTILAKIAFLLQSSPEQYARRTLAANAK